MLPSSEREIWWTQNQLTVKPHTHFPHRRIIMMNIFFSFLKILIFVRFPCHGWAGRCLGIIIYAMVLQLFLVCLHWLPRLSIPCRGFTQTLGSAAGDAFCCFPGKDCYKKHAQHEGGSRCRLALHAALQLPAYGGWLKKWIWMVWKSIHPVSQRINYFFLVICCMLSWLCLPVLLWRNALDSQDVQIRTTLCADFLRHRVQDFQLSAFCLIVPLMKETWAWFMIIKG